MKASSKLEASGICCPLQVMEIRFDGVNNVGGLRTLNGARFGMTRNDGKKAHQGIDLYANPGTHVFSVANGRVVYTGAGKDFGKFVILEFVPETNWANYLGLGAGATLFALYAHLSVVNVSVGKIGKARMIGATGITGNADQRYPHLHFEIRTKRNPGKGLADRLNPEKIFMNIDYSKAYRALDALSNVA